MKTLSLTIPGMKSNHCQMTVSGVVQALGASISTIAPTQINIEIDESVGNDDVKSAIEGAGYKVEEILNR